MEYVVRTGKRRVHAALLVDGINEVKWLDNHLEGARRSFFMWASREYPAEATACASAAKKAR